MSGKYLLDTNIIIKFLAGDPEVGSNIAAASQIFVPCIVLGELMYGAQKSSRPTENLLRIETFNAGVTILDCTQETARQYGRLRFALHRLGRPIPENDIWIAALAQQHGLTLVTHDKHFTAIPELKQENW